MTKKEAIFPALAMLFIIAFMYPFMIIEANWGEVLIAFFFTLGFSSFSSFIIGKRFQYPLFLFIFSIQIFTTYYFNGLRNSSEEKITIRGKITHIYVNTKKATLEIGNYPGIDFKSYYHEDKQRLKSYNIMNSEPIYVNLGKNVELIVYKSHLEFAQKNIVKFWKGFRYPNEIEVISMKIVD